MTTSKVTRGLGRRRRSRSRGRRGGRSRSRSKAKKRSSKPVVSSPPACQGHEHRKPEGWLDHLIDYDMKFSRWVHEQGLRIFFHLFLRTLEFSGNGIFLIPAAAATYLLPRERLTPETRTFFFNLLGAFIADLIIVTLIKNYVRRPRPCYNTSHIITNDVEHWSFPSRHSTRALMVVTFFSMYLPMWKDQAANVWLPFLKKLLSHEVNVRDEGVPVVVDLLVSIVTWLVFSWAVATTSSRIILGRHFFFDVLVGSLIGILESMLYNNFLFIPPEVSEAVHAYISSVFASIDDAIWKFFNGASLYIQNLTKTT